MLREFVWAQSGLNNVDNDGETSQQMAVKQQQTAIRDKDDHH